MGRHLTYCFFAAFIAGYALSASPASAEYAIAFGRGGGKWAFGSAYNSPTMEQAKKQALEQCGLKTCKIVLSGRGQCAALSVSRENSSVAWTSDEKESKAREDVLIECSTMGKRCTINTSFCDSAPPPPPVVTAPTPETPAPATTETKPKNDNLPRALATFGQSYHKAFMSKISACWKPRFDYPKDVSASMVVHFNSDGTVKGRPPLAAISNNPDSADFGVDVIEALTKCGPYTMFPSQHYGDWKVLHVTARYADMVNPSTSAQNPKLDTLTTSQIAAFRKKVQKCWVVTQNELANGLIADVRIQLAQDGTLLSTPVVVSFSKTDGGYNFAVNAISAVQVCAPYLMFSESEYSLWKDLEIRFNARDFTTPK